MEKYRRVRPAREPLENDEIRVTAMGRVMNYVSYAGTLITDQKLRQLTIKASGNAIGQAIALAEQLKRRYKGLHQLNTCGNTTVSLVYEPIEEGLDQVTEERVVAFLEIKLSFDPLDQNDPGYQAPFDEATFNELKPVAAPGPSGQLRGRGGYRGGMRGRGRNFGGEGTEGEGGDSGGAEDFDEDQAAPEGSGYRGRGSDRGECSCMHVCMHFAVDTSARRSACVRSPKLMTDVLIVRHRPEGEVASVVVTEDIEGAPEEACGEGGGAAPSEDDENE
ncbi:hypothetical protein Esti_001616 [Eimeria stiedai]